MKSEKPLVEIKGFGETLGLLIDKTVTFEQIENDLKTLLKRPNSKHFFQGAEIFLQENERQLTSDEFIRLAKLLKFEGDLHLKIESIEQSTTPPEAESSPEFLQKSVPSSEKSLKMARLPANETIEQEQQSFSAVASLLPSSSTTQPPTRNLQDDSDSATLANATASLEKKDHFLSSYLPKKGLKTADALLVRQTLHSGQDICSQSSVVLMGDLNAGAEIVSDHDVIVLGSIRGMVHAGASGNRQACVFALRMQPTQLRIAELITQPSIEDKKTRQVEPEIAFIEEGFIIIESCHKIRV